MVLTIPPYLLTAPIQQETIRYKWDDWDEEGVEGAIDDKLYGRLKTLSQRANVAFTAASAEWIVYRFGRLSDDSLPLQCLEAAWAQMIDGAYSVPWEFPDDKTWSGPVRSPIRRAMSLVADAINEMVVDSDPALMAAIISKLVEHLMSDPKPYQSWRERVLERLDRLYRLDPAETIGDVVPREAFDPNADFKPEQTEHMVNQFLAGLNYHENALLNSPTTMLEKGFQGTPYQFNIEKDRQNRFEW